MAERFIPTRLGSRKKNAYRVEGETAVLMLTGRRGEFRGETRINLCDLPRVLAEGKWFLTRARRSAKGATGFYPLAVSRHIRGEKCSPLPLHRFVMGEPAGLEIDHINHDTLDNRRENLRVVSKSQNQQNIAGAHHDSKSGARNVYWHAQLGRWSVQVCVDYKRTSFGTYATVEEAAAVAERARQALQTHCPENSKTTFHTPLPSRRGN